MSNSRLEKIEAMLVAEPNDFFLRYSLAMELDKLGRNDESLKGFEALMSEEAPFVPAFFMAAQQLVRLNQVDQARSTLRDGIENARMQGETHAAGEMSELLASLGAMGE